MTGWITHNPGWKLLSLALAVLLWLAFVGDPEVAASASVPVQYRNLPKDLEMSSDVVEKMHLEIRGPSGKLRAAQLADLAVVLDLGGVTRPGQRTFTIAPGNINLPSGVTLLRAVPAQVRLQFEQLLTRDVPVEVRFSAAPPEGYQIGEQVVDPPRVRILGPESRVESVISVQTDPIDLSATVGRRDFRVPTSVTDPQVRFEGSTMVSVRVETVRKARK